MAQAGKARLDVRVEMFVISVLWNEEGYYNDVIEPQYIIDFASYRQKAGKYILLAARRQVDSREILGFGNTFMNSNLLNTPLNNTPLKNTPLNNALLNNDQSILVQA
jgi:hypothetical protein